MSYANNKDEDQPAHLRTLISAFVVHCLDGIIPLVSISESSHIYLASVATQADLSLPWSQIPKTDFLVTWLIFQQRMKCQILAQGFLRIAVKLKSFRHYPFIIFIKDGKFQLFLNAHKKASHTTFIDIHRNSEMFPSFYIMVCQLEACCLKQDL